MSRDSGRRAPSVRARCCARRSRSAPSPCSRSSCSTLVGVVLCKGGQRQAAAERHARRHPDAGLRLARSGARPDAGGVGARVRDLREAPQLSRRAAATAGTRLVPEVAASLPRISRDRLTYTFQLRPGWRFSDGEPVTAASFARAFERARSPELVSPAEPYLREVASWQARGRTLTIRLRTPAPDFTQRLALPYFCAVPTSAPNDQSDTLPSAGPFAIASYTPGRSLVLRRNPYYHGPRHPTCSGSSTTSVRSPRRSACSSSTGRPTTASSRRRRSRRSRRSSRATRRTCSSCSSRSSPTSR